MLKGIEKSSVIQGDLRDTEWITIRVWQSRVGEELTSARKAVKAYVRQHPNNVGHVSIETPRIYASLWPEEGASPGLKSGVPSQSAQTTAEDIENECNRDPDVVVTLYSLNLNRLEAHYANVRTQQPDWVLKGRNRYRHSGNSCSGLAFDLLQVAGIELLATGPWTLSWVTTPNGVAELITKAKAKELKIYPGTAQFQPTKPLSSTTLAGSGSTSNTTSTMVIDALAREQKKQKKLRKKIQALELANAKNEGILEGLRLLAGRNNLPAFPPPYVGGPSPMSMNYPPAYPMNPPWPMGYGYPHYGLFAHPGARAPVPMNHEHVVSAPEPSLQDPSRPKSIGEVSETDKEDITTPSTSNPSIDQAKSKEESVTLSSLATLSGSRQQATWEEASLDGSLPKEEDDKPRGPTKGQ